MTLAQRVAQKERELAELKKAAQPEENPMAKSLKKQISFMKACKERVIKIVPDSEILRAALSRAEEHCCSLESSLRRLESTLP